MDSKLLFTKGIRRSFMRTLTLILGAMIVALMTTQVSAAENRTPSSHDGHRYSCRIVTGYGTAIGFGATQLDAKASARELCGSKIIDQYLAQRGNIPNDVAEDLTTACVNEECQ
jgi:hypothetical protein